MLRLGEGPNLELFTYSGTSQRDPVVPSDFGIQHFCVYVDDIDEAADRLERAGARLLSAPTDLPGGDAGPGNRYLYARTPWGEHGGTRLLPVTAGVRERHGAAPVAARGHL